MYAWIWRKLPFGLPGKLAGSLLLLTAVFLALWFVVFPAVQPYMPYNDGTVEDPGDDGGGDDDDPGVPEYDPSDFELEESPESEGPDDE